MTEPQRASHWSRPDEHFARVGPPMRPPPAAIAAYAAALGPHAGPMLVLGSTPELATLADDVTAVDRSEAMLARVWPAGDAARRAVLGEWTALPFGDATFAAAACDGGLTCVAWPDAAARVRDELARVLRPGGRAAIRLFARPEHDEAPGDVLASARARAIGSFHACKWRFATALASARHDRHVAVREVLEAFDALVADRGALAREAGWDARVIDTIDAYRGSPDVYAFPTVDEAVALWSRAFDVRVVGTGDYELAERFPLLVLDARG